MTSSKLIAIGLIAAAVVAAFFVVRNLPERQPAGSTATAPKGNASGRGGPAAALPVYTYEVQARPLQERIIATGTLAADESVDLVAELSGKIVSISFQEGSRVSRGDTLVRIDDSDLRAQLARAESRVTLARTQAERVKQLGVGVGATQETVDAALNEVRVLEAEAELVRVQLAKTELRAPFDGIIGLRSVSEGSYLIPSTRIASLQKIDPIKIDFAVAERHLERLQPGVEVRVTAVGRDQPFIGQVYAIEPQIDVATRTLRLRARAPNPGGRVLPGGFASIEVPLREIPEALVVPADAIVAGAGQQQVYLVVEGRAQPRPVQLGLRLEREVQIVSGLQPGDVVITSGQLQVRPNMPVRPVARDAAPAGTSGAPAGAGSPPAKVATAP
jgi:membrane fusion protein, multidrug efflux system